MHQIADLASQKDAPPLKKPILSTYLKFYRLLCGHSVTAYRVVHTFVSRMVGMSSAPIKAAVVHCFVRFDFLFRHLSKNKNRPSGLLLTNGLDSYSVVLSAQGWSGVRFGPGRELQKDSCGAAQGKCSFPWDGIGMANGTPGRFHQAVCKTAIAPGRCIIAPYYNRVGTFRASCRS